MSEAITCSACRWWQRNEQWEVPAALVQEKVKGWFFTSDKYDHHDLWVNDLQRIRAIANNRSGWCHLNPKQVETEDDYHCSHHERSRP